jgi:hypothetical protein
MRPGFFVSGPRSKEFSVFDDILDLFNRRKRQHEADHPSSEPRSRLPFDVPFRADDDDDDGWDRRRHDDERHSPRRPSSGKQTRDDDWF